MITAYWADWEVERGPTNPHLVQSQGRRECLKHLLLCDAAPHQCQMCHLCIFLHMVKICQDLNNNHDEADMKKQGGGNTWEEERSFSRYTPVDSHRCYPTVCYLTDLS